MTATEVTNVRGPANLVRVNVRVTARQPADWPHYAGSTLRGALGRALREAACVTGKPDCNGCPLRKHCSYGAVFDPLPPSQPLHPSFRNGLPLYIVQPPGLGACRLDTGMTQEFSILMLPGSAPHMAMMLRMLPAFVERHLIRPGLFKLDHTSTEDIPVNQGDKEISTGLNDAPAVQLKLRWRTPFRLQENGRPFTDARKLDTRLLVRAFLRRQIQWCQMTEQPAPDASHFLNAASNCQIDTRNLHWHDIQRLSSIRNEKIPLGGLIGTATLHGPGWAIRELLPLIWLTEQIHVGKETIMGLGQFHAGKPEPG